MAEIKRPEIGVALIGTKFMGRAHSHAYFTVASIFPDCPRPRLRVICGRDRALAWWLRVAGALLLCGHAGYGLVMRKDLLAQQYATIWSGAPAGLERGIGAGEFALAGLVLLRPSAPLAFLACGWKLASELLYPATGAPFWEVIERAGSYGVLLSLAVLLRPQAAGNSPAGSENALPVAGGSTT